MYETDKLTLSFKDKNLEREFLKYYAQRYIEFVRPSLLLAAFLYAVFGILHWLIDRDGGGNVLFFVGLVVFLSIAVTLTLTVSRHFERFMQEIISVAVLMGGLAVIYITVFASDPQNNLYYVGLLLVLMYSYTLISLRFIYALTVTTIIIVVYLVVARLIIFKPAADTIPSPDTILWVNAYYLLSADFIGAVSGRRIERYIRKDYIQNLKKDEWLLKIFPPWVVDRWLEDPSEVEVIVRKSDDATILFADLGNFTKLSAPFSPHALVVQLNEIFSDFDKICKENGLEKIKTIGDGYMAAAGLSDDKLDHARMSAKAALEMQAHFVAKFGPPTETKENFSLRIGLNSGPVVAGVIRGEKPGYDVWGKTVNIASRMEFHSEAGKILVSKETRLRLDDDYEFEEPQIIEVKGLGSIETYFLVRRREQDNN